MSSILNKEDILFASVAIVTKECDPENEHFGEKALLGKEVIVGHREGNTFISADDRKFPILDFNNTTKQYNINDKKMGDIYAVALISYYEKDKSKISLSEAMSLIKIMYKKLATALDGNVKYPELLEDKFIRKQDIVMASIVEVARENELNDNYGEIIFSAKNTVVGYREGNAFITEHGDRIQIMEPNERTQQYSCKDKKIGDIYAICAGSYYKRNETQIPLIEALKIISAMNNEILNGIKIGIQRDSNEQDKVK